MTTTKKMGLARQKQEHTMGTVTLASPEEGFLGLALKLHEEVAEVVQAPEDVEEYGDVLQVLMDFAYLNGIAWVDVVARRRKKMENKGGYIPPQLWKRFDKNG